MTNHETSTGRKDGWMNEWMGGWVNVEQRKCITIDHLFSIGMESYR